MGITNYVAPQIEIIEVNIQSVLCGSGGEMNSNGGINPYERETFEFD